MKLKQPESLTYVLLTAGLLILTLIFVNSCRKDNRKVLPSPQSPLVTAINADIPNLKVIYAKAMGSNGLSVKSVGGKALNLIKTLDVNWNTYTLQKRRDSSILAEFDMNNDTGLFVLQKLTPGDTIKYANKTDVVFIKYKDGSRLNFFMKVVEDLTVPASKEVIKSLHYGEVPPGFCGMILYYTLDRQYINGYHFTYGIADGTITFPSTAGQQQIESVGKLRIDLIQQCTDYYIWETDCTWGGTPTNPYATFQGCDTYLVGTYTVCGSTGGGGVGGDTGGTGSGGTSSTPCNTPPGTVAQASVTNGRLIVDVAQPLPPGDGSGGTTPCSTTTTTTTTNGDPCAAGMSLQSNNTFNTELKDLKTKLNQNYEAGYAATTTGSPQYRTGTPGTLTWIPPQLTEVADNSLLYISHTHYVDPKSLSIFSDADVDAFSSYLYNNKAANKNTFSLTVTNSQGVTYALVLSNETQFDSFYNTYLSTTNAQNIFSSLFNNYVNGT